MAHSRSYYQWLMKSGTDEAISASSKMTEDKRSNRSQMLWMDGDIEKGKVDSIDIIDAFYPMIVLKL